MSVLYIRDQNGNFVPIPTMKGPKGDSGVFVGDQTPSDSSVKVWVNPNGIPSAALGDYYTKSEIDAAIEAATAERPLEVIRNFVVEETAATLLIDTDNEGKPLELMYALLYISAGGDVEAGNFTGGTINFGTVESQYYARLNNNSSWTYPGYKISEGNYRKSSIKAECYIDKGVTKVEGYIGDEGSVSSEMGKFTGINMKPTPENISLTRVMSSIEIPKNAVVTLYGIRKVNSNV